MAAPIATFRSTGETIDYTPTSDVAAGDVIVIGSLIGIATSPISANKLGSLRVSGIFLMPKASGTAITAGTALYWDATNKRVATTDGGGTNKALGKAAADAASAATTIMVLKTP